MIGPPLRRERQPRGRRGVPPRPSRRPSGGNVEIGKERTPPGGTAASYWSPPGRLNDGAVSGGDRFRSGALQIAADLQRPSGAAANYQLSHLYCTCRGRGRRSSCQPLITRNHGSPVQGSCRSECARFLHRSLPIGDCWFLGWSRFCRLSNASRETR